LPRPGQRDTDAQLQSARSTLDAIVKRLGADDVADAELAKARRTLLDLQHTAEDVSTEQAKQLQTVQSRLTELGPAPPSGGEEPPDMTAQRQALQTSSSQVDARVKLARLLAVESAQAADRAAGLARDRFHSHLFERTDALVTSDFWDDVRASLQRDRIRLTQALHPEERRPASVWAGFVAIVLAAAALRWWLRRMLERVVADCAPQGRIQRSVYALVRVLLATLVPAAAAGALLLVVGRRVVVGANLESIAWGAMGPLCLSAYVVGLGNALVQPDRPSWRLLAIPDAIARGLRGFPLLLGATIFIGWLLERLAAFVQTGLPTAVAVNALVSFVLASIVALALWRADRARTRAAAGREAGASGAREASDREEPTVGDRAGAAPPRPLWLSLLLVAMSAALAATLIGVIAGFVALGGFVVRQLVWAAILFGSGYLLAVVTDDVASVLLTRAVVRARTEGAPEVRAGSVPVGRLAQAIVLGSAGLRITVWLLVLLLLLAHFGEGPSELLGRTDLLGTGLTVGELHLRPAALLQAMLVLAATLIALKATQHWLAHRFLPTTSLDAGMRSSLGALPGFVGVVVAMALALSAIGLTLDKVAWIASALSVGIGFGLQAIVSNFVSGLILLAERPVKVGDRVALSGVEGDIQRINMRTTEIQMHDRSTVIVPNSEFLTKVVRNLTHDNTLGWVQFKFPVPLASDIDRVRTIVLEAFTQNEDALEEPAPTVLIDGVDGGNLIFNAMGFVTSPRRSDLARSALLSRVLHEVRRMEPAKP
jgi:small-conductance mechanosensitive channel